MLDYIVKEVSIVTEEELEKVINETIKEGYYLDGINFAMRESSKRPSMAFVVFTKERLSSEKEMMDKAEKGKAKKRKAKG